MKKLPNWDEIIPQICCLVAMLCEFILMATCAGQATIPVQNYVLQCVNCVFWIFSFMIIFSMKGE